MKQLTFLNKPTKIKVCKLSSSVVVKNGTNQDQDIIRLESIETKTFRVQEQDQDQDLKNQREIITKQKIMTSIFFSFNSSLKQIKKRQSPDYSVIIVLLQCCLCLDWS